MEKRKTERRPDLFPCAAGFLCSARTPRRLWRRSKSDLTEKRTDHELSAEKAEVLKKVRRMSDSEVKAVLAFVNTLSSINREKDE